MGRLMIFRKRRDNWGRAAAFAMLLVALAGCGRGGNLYSPHSLPADLQVAKSENARTIDLSKLATQSVSSEQIDCGDVLNIAVAAGYGAEKVDNVPVRVGEDGIANIPVIGRVPLAETELRDRARALSQSVGDGDNEQAADQQDHGLGRRGEAG
jgi:predicted small lipoprotein YifL